MLLFETLAGYGIWLAFLATGTECIMYTIQMTKHWHKSEVRDRLEAVIPSN